VGFLLLLAATFGLMYALIIRPQQKRLREQQSLVRALSVGDEVMTSSGIYGIVTELEDETFLIEVAEGIEMRMARGAVAKIETKGAAPPAAATPDAEDDEPSDADDAHDNS
jgi:preprotein translocase subunit YajC